MNKEELNNAIIQRMIEVIERSGLAAQAEFFAAESLNQGRPATRQSIRAILQDICTTFPDAKFEPLNVVADGDWVVLSCYMTGTHRGVSRHPFVHEGLLKDVPPTGRRVRVHHIHMFRIQAGLIVEHCAARDDIGMMRQLGFQTAVRDRREQLTPRCA